MLMTYTADVAVIPCQRYRVRGCSVPHIKSLSFCGTCMGPLGGVGLAGSPRIPRKAFSTSSTYSCFVAACAPGLRTEAARARRRRRKRRGDGELLLLLVLRESMDMIIVRGSCSLLMGE